MAPALGDIVFVNERSDYTGDTTVSPAIVTHVYSQDDGDPAWWNAAQDKEIVDVVTFRRNGSSESQTVGKAETITGDDGETYKVGYDSSPDAAASAPAPAPAPATPAPATPDATVTPPATPDATATSGTTTDTVGDGTTPQGTGTDTTGQPVV